MLNKTILFLLVFLISSCSHTGVSRSISSLEFNSCSKIILDFVDEGKLVNLYFGQSIEISNIDRTKSVRGNFLGTRPKQNGEVEYVIAVEGEDKISTLKPSQISAVLSDFDRFVLNGIEHPKIIKQSQGNCAAHAVSNCIAIVDNPKNHVNLDTYEMLSNISERTEVIYGNGDKSVELKIESVIEEANVEYKWQTIKGGDDLEVILNHLSENKPVQLHYRPSPDAKQSPTPVETHEGHAVMLLGTFRAYDGRDKVLVFNSGNGQSMIWDARSLLISPENIKNRAILFDASLGFTGELPNHLKSLWKNSFEETDDLVAKEIQDLIQHESEKIKKVEIDYNFTHLSEVPIGTKLAVSGIYNDLDGRSGTIIGKLTMYEFRESGGSFFEIEVDSKRLTYFSKDLKSLYTILN